MVSEEYFIVRDSKSFKYIAIDPSSGGYVYKVDESLRAKRFSSREETLRFIESWERSPDTTNAKDWLVCRLKIDVYVA